jgi:CO/xanthine dehydrogenase Mo-binding subunit
LPVSEFDWIGKKMITSKASAKVTGRLEFADDAWPKGLLIGRVLRSPYPHAKVLKIDISKAEKLSGVKAVITGKDFAGRYGPAITDQPILAQKVVRYTGDPVAAVSALDEETAIEALSLIEVVYEPLPAVFEGEQAVKQESPLVHPDLRTYDVAPGIFPLPGTNICNRFKLRRGDTERALSSAAHVFTHRLSTQKVQHSSIEPHVCTAQADASGRVQIRSTTQTPFVTRKALGKAFGMSLNKIRVLATRLGGGFGGKAYPKLEPIAMALALRSDNRPVRLSQDREGEFCGSTVTRHPTNIEITSGLDSNGKILARRIRMVFNTGAYADIGPRVVRNAGFSSAGPYVIPNVWVNADCVYTNTTPSGALRGLGIPQVTWAVETHTDMIAHDLGLDPLRLRLENAAEEGSTSATGQVLHSVGLKEALRQAAATIGLNKARPALVGRGIACGHKSTVSPSASSCVVRVNEDGTVQILTSTVDMGQGSDRALAQIAAEELGIDPDRIVMAQPDTDVTPYDMATVSSRSTFFMGNAIRSAAQKIREKALDIAADLFEANRKDLVFEKGRVFVSGSPSRSLSLAQIPQGESFYAGAGQSGSGQPLVAEGVYTVEDATPLDPAVFWMYFAQAAEVAVDLDTGLVRVLRIASAHDVGRAINPLLLEGQIEGACLMGIGEALHEEMLYRQGQVTNPNFLDYRIPTFQEVPEIIPIIVECPHNEGPFGAKGMGEPALAGIPAAIGNAIFDAIGVRLTDLPLTADRVLKAIEMKKLTEKS